MEDQTDNSFGLYVARRLTEMPDSEWPGFFHDLCKARQLSNAMHEMNNLLQETDHASVARGRHGENGFRHGNHQTLIRGNQLQF